MQTLLLQIPVQQPQRSLLWKPHAQPTDLKTATMDKMHRYLLSFSLRPWLFYKTDVFVQKSQTTRDLLIHLGVFSVSLRNSETLRTNWLSVRESEIENCERWT